MHRIQATQLFHKTSGPEAQAIGSNGAQKAQVATASEISADTVSDRPPLKLAVIMALPTHQVPDVLLTLMMSSYWDLNLKSNFFVRISFRQNL